MHKHRIVLICMALVLTLALLIPLFGCGGGETGTTATPTSTGATPTKTSAATKTPATTSGSGKTLADIYGVGKNIGDVKYDQVMTMSGEVQSITSKGYMKNLWLEDKMKFRFETTQDEMTTIMIIDMEAQVAYNYLPDQNMAYKIDMSQAEQTDPTEDADQIHPTHVGTATIDGHPCDIWQWTDQGTTEKMWIWTAKSFPVKMEMTTSSGTSTMEYKNIVFGKLSDSLFQLPAGVQIMQFPGST